MANPNKVQYGLSSIAFAKQISSAANERPEYDKPVKNQGAVSLTMNSDTEEINFYADNIKYWGTFIDNGYSGEIELARLLDEVAEFAYGWYIDSLGGRVERTNGQKHNFAILGQFEGDANAVRWVIYNCTAGKPSRTNSTIERSAEPQTDTLPYTATSVYVGDDVMATLYSIADDPNNTEVHAAYSTWFDEVKFPVPVEDEGE